VLAALGEGVEDAFPIRLGHAGAGVGDGEPQGDLACGSRATLDAEQDAARLGELHRVAGEVEQHLTQAAFIGEQDRQVSRRGPGDLQPLGMGAGAEQFGGGLQQRLGLKRRRMQGQLAGIQPRKVENVVDQAQQVLAAVLQCRQIGPLIGGQTGVGQQPRR